MFNYYIFTAAVNAIANMIVYFINSIRNKNENSFTEGMKKILEAQIATRLSYIGIHGGTMLTIKQTKELYKLRSGTELGLYKSEEESLTWEEYNQQVTKEQKPYIWS